MNSDFVGSTEHHKRTHHSVSIQNHSGSKNPAVVSSQTLKRLYLSSRVGWDPLKRFTHEFPL